MSLDLSKEKRAKIQEALDEFLQASYEQVAESEARLMGILQASPTGTLMIDRNGLIQFINPALVRLFAYSEDELIGEKVEVLLPENLRKDHPQLRDAFFVSPTMRAMGGNRNLLGETKRRHLCFGNDHGHF
jgi:PAS domain-containing protein